MKGNVIQMTWATEPQAIDMPPIREASALERQIQSGLAFVSGIVLAVSLGAIAIEASRNYSFGARGIVAPRDALISGGTCAMFAVLLMALPFLARYAGWRRWMWAFYLGCFGVTAYCGVAYYVDDIRAKDRDAQQVTRKFEDARRELANAESERDDARAEMRRAQDAADAIGENTPTSELRALAEKAEERAKKEATDEKRGAKCGDVCRAAEKERDGYLRRKPDAMAKESALARADTARSRAEEAQKRINVAKTDAATGPAEASGMAGLAGDLGVDAKRYAAIEGLVVPVVKVIGLLGAAALLDIAMTVFLYSLGYGPEPRRALALPAKAPGRSADAEPVTEVKPTAPMTERERQIALALEIFAPSSSAGLPAGDVQERFVEEHTQRWPELPAPRKNIISQVMADAGFTKDRKKGPTRYHVALN